MAKITIEMMQQVLQHVGGRRNIKLAGNCMTRLRLTLNDDQLVDKAALKQIAGVLGVIESDEQLQIIVGPGKAQTAADLMNQLLEGEDDDHQAASSPHDLKDIASANKQQLKKKQTSAVHRFYQNLPRYLPLNSRFYCCWLIIRFCNTGKTELFPCRSPTKPEEQTLLVHTILYMSVFSKGLFSFLSILIGYNTQKPLAVAQ